MPDTTATKKVVVTSTQLADIKKPDAGVQQAPQQRLIRGVATDLCQSEAISGALAVVPPLMSTKFHLHPDIETILFIIEGFGVTLVGPEMEVVLHGPGEFVYIPKNTLHLGANLSDKERIVILEMRTDPNFDGVELHPEFEEAAAKTLKDLQEKFAAGTLELPAHFADRDFSPYRFKA